MLILASLIVSLIAIAILTMFMVLSIDRISNEVMNRSRHNMSRMLDEYDDAIEEKRKELVKLNHEILSAQNEKIIAKSTSRKKEHAGSKTYSRFENEPDTPIEEIYRTIKDNFVFDFDRIANSILVMKNYKNDKYILIKSILGKISSKIFMEIDTLNDEEQEALFKEFLKKDEYDLIKSYGCYGIDLYERLKLQLNQYENELSVNVASKQIKETLAKKNIESEVSDDLIEGLNIVFNGKLYEYSINRKELY